LIAQFIARAVKATTDAESAAVAADVAALVKQFPAYPRG
jgi:glycine/serine hydroxymethyltransferase